MGLNAAADIILSPHEVHLWTERLNCGLEIVTGARAVISADEIARAERFVRGIHHDRYIVSHATVRTILSQYIAVPASQIVFEHDRFGKPSLAASMNPCGINFNLSHSGDRLLLGVALNARIGVDIEEIRPEAASLDVAARFFTERENKDLRSLAGEEQIRAFFNCWTRKEAYLKAIGSGLSADPRNCEVSLKPAEKPAIRRQLPTDKLLNSWSLFHVAEEHYISAIAVDHPTILLKQKSG